jgi:hypothetical protein
LSREESAVSPLAASRFLADKAGFGMTRGEIVFAQNAPRPLGVYLLPGWNSPRLENCRKGHSPVLDALGAVLLPAAAAMEFSEPQSAGVG